MNVFALSGSLRKDSYNTALLRAASEVLPAGMTLDVATLEGVPVYDGDLEAREGLPASVTALKNRAMAADAILLATPEYNGSIPGPLKNTIDWMSRPPADMAKVFGKPVGVIGATPGPVGTRLSQTAWLPVFRALGLTPYVGLAVYVDGASRAFDAEGKLVDAKTRERLTAYLAGFATFVARFRG